jgi:monofunctional biosynthetic peptidoglycan transglycosylase
VGAVSEPIVEPEAEGAAMPAPRRSRRATFRFWAWRVFVVLVVLAIIPAVLTILYIPHFVHPVSTLMLKDLATFSGYDRRWVALDDVAPALQASVIMSEDNQFCFHQGVDWTELNGVIDDALAGEATRGASTITMQTAKNLYLWHRPLGTVRKVFEIPLAIYVDMAMTKKRILEIYLNIAEWGPGIFGAEAAARYHFRKPALLLTPREASLLAVSLPNPFERQAGRPGPGTLRLADNLLLRMRAAQANTACVRARPDRV